MTDISFSEKKIFPRTPVLLLMTGFLMLGIAFIAILPPWEGLDETAHYSYLQQLSDARSLARIHSSFISEDVEDYARHAPVAYSSVPPFENNGGFTYRSFFDSPIHIINKGFAYIHQIPDQPRQYTPGKTENWEAQHPPLYYLLLAPVYRFTRHFSWAAQIFILRMCSYALAWSALLLAISSCLIMIQLNSIKQNSLIQYWIIFGTAIIPVLFPSWFPEMARMGNDSLCALIMSLIWYFSLRAYQHGLKLIYSALIGALLGMGCLTKVFFIPLSAGVFCYWIIRQWKLQGKKCLPRLAANISLMLVLIIGMSGWWYYRNWHEFGVFSGADEIISLAARGGMVEGLKQHFSFASFIRGCAAFVTALGWCCTWSLAQPHYIFLAPLAIIGLWTMATYAYTLKTQHITSLSWMPLWFLFPFLLVFFYHVLVRIALTGQGTGAGGYYLLFMVAPLGVMAGLGYSGLWLKPSLRIITLILMVYAVVFAVVISWEQMLLFAGVLFKAGGNPFYQFPDTLPRLLGIPEAVRRLDIIAFPKTGMIFWLLGEFCIITGLISGFNSIYLIRKEMLSVKIDPIYPAALS